jgi:hypothetical protein
LYFGCKVGDQDKNWAPHICCTTCSSNISALVNCKGHYMPFAVPMIWREPTNHTSECYFSIVPPIKKGVTMKKKWTVSYPNVPSAIRPVSPGEGLPIPSLDSSRPHNITETELNDLIRDLELPKNKTEFLASRLQQWVGEPCLDTRSEVSLNKNH